MYRKVFHKKFPSQSEATEYADANGWDYIGRRGIFKRYHLYVGVTMTAIGQVSEHHKLRLYNDGYVSLYNDFNDKATLYTSKLPSRVWASKDIYDHLEKCTIKYNLKLHDEYSDKYMIENIWHQKYAVYKIRAAGSGISRIVVKPPVKIFSSPGEAYKWAASSSVEC